MSSSWERGSSFGVLVRSAMAGCAHLFATLETSNHSQADMARRTGSADLPLHGGRVPAWLGQRMVDARRRHLPGHRASLRPRRIPAAALASLLVPVLRRRHGHGLALVGHHHERHRRAEARPRAAGRRARHPCLRRPRQAFAPNARGAASRSAIASASTAPALDPHEPPGGQGRQRRGAGRLRSLPAWLLRHR